MKQYNKAIHYCDTILENEKDNKTLLEFRKKCASLAKDIEQSERKKQFFAKKKQMEEDNLVKEILKRGYKLEGVFETYPEWDEKHQYKAENLNVYFETAKKKLVQTDVNSTLKQILNLPGYVIRGGTPSFMILVRDSPAEKRLLKEYES
ncbi:unnamed protein product [Acanthoscelides obtectus]|uniref:Cns1/TTC4 wheel domain-containing protein n=1 Tax=Acanthoscelides obtectus TaxID=200917 RepID=A0A9P0LYR8_ACAOB|nr:unnamed protein product [Acanthoscelides obtectus]CAK1638748.1 Tetratricopeptide repeat protein 4 [Acanthoscelides obtectus]